MKNSCMPQHDAATGLTLQYLHLLETHLQITWNEQGKPVCIIDWIRDKSVAALHEALNELFNGQLHADARQATIEYGKHHIQTVGFGLASDFKEFIKLGLIYGERVVLWDIVGSRILSAAQVDARSTSLLAQIACQLLMLRGVIERGGIVILGHPVTWSTLAAEIDEDLRTEGNASASDLGLSMAFAAIEEGLPLHPYTLLRGSLRPSVAERVAAQVNDLYSSKHYVFQKAICGLLRDQRVAYLRDVRVEDFFDVVVAHEGLCRALWKFFSTLEGLSAQQGERELEALAEELVGLIAKRNAAVSDYVAEGVDASASVVLASVATLTVGMPLLQVLAGAGALAVPLTKAVRKWVNKPARNVVVQAFEALENVAEMQADDLTPNEMPEPFDGIIEPNIQDLYVRFKAFHWTQDRHELLESLSPEVAKAVLGLLRPADIGPIVNHRRFQEDYIGDYLAHLWTLDENFYWEHLGKTFESPDGLLIYDSDDHIRTMESHAIPMKVWRQLLDSLLVAHADELFARKYGYPLERIMSVITFQSEQPADSDEKRAALLSIYDALGSDERSAFTDFLSATFGGELPSWILSRGKL